MSNCPDNLGFLIDENLTPELASVIAARGFRAHVVSRDKKLRGRSDAVIARYAIDNDLIVVTNNVVDFEKIYVRRECHPGLIFICAESPVLRRKECQLTMMDIALDEIQRDCLCQEAVRVTARKGRRRTMKVDIDRFYLPDLEAIAEEAAA